MKSTRVWGQRGWGRSVGGNRNNSDSSMESTGDGGNRVTPPENF